MNRPHSVDVVPIAPEWRDEWARELAAEGSREAKADGVGYLVFRAGTEIYALPAARVVRTGPLPRPHRIPRRSIPVLGVSNLDGTLFLVFSVRALLRAAGEGDTAETMFVYQDEDIQVCCAVSETLAVVPFRESDWLPMPPALAPSAPCCARHCTEWQGRTVLQIDASEFNRSIREAAR